MSGRRGFTLVEALIAAAVLAIAVLGFMASWGSAEQLRRGSRDTELATAAIGSEVEALRGRPHETAVAAALERRTFQVPGLARSSGTVEVLSEADAALTFGAPLLDLDGDSLADEDDAGSNRLQYAALIPVRVTVSWDSVTNARTTIRRSAKAETLLYPVQVSR